MRLFFLFFVFCFETLFSPPLPALEEPCRRVLFIMPSLVVGGAENAFVTLMNGWNIPHTKVEIFLLSRGGALEPNIRKDFCIISKRKAFARRYDVAVNYAHWVDPDRWLKKVQTKKKVQWIHTDHLLALGDLPFKRANSCLGIDWFICVSKKVEESMLKLHPEVASNMSVIHNVLNQEKVREHAKEIKDCFPKDGLCNVLSAGHLFKVKAYDRAIRVHSRLDKEGIHFRWYVAGEGRERPVLEKLIEEHHLEGKFILLGQQSNPYPYMLQADIYAHPSLCEGCSVAINEAKVLGKPIIATDVGGAREQIDSERNGLVVDNSEEAIYEGLKRLLFEPQLRHKFSEALQDFNYDNDEIYRQLERALFQ